MERPNYRKGSIIFDDDTILQVEQRGGGGSGVGGETGLAAVNLKTGESTNAALAEKDETIAEQAGTIEEQAATIETQAATIEEQNSIIADLRQNQMPLYGFDSIVINNNSAASVGVIAMGAYIDSNVKTPYILDTNEIGGIIAPNASSNLIPASAGNKYYVGRDMFEIYYEPNDDTSKTLTLTTSGGGGVSVTKTGSPAINNRISYKRGVRYKVTPGTKGSGGTLTITIT